MAIRDYFLPSAESRRRGVEGEHAAVIVGGGIGGLACAVALRQRGYDCVVYERAPELRELGAGLLLTPNACTVLDRLGILAALADRSLPTPAWEILDARGRMLQRIRPFRNRSLGVSTRRSDLQQALLAALPEDAVRLDHEASGVEVDGLGARVRFRNGARVETPLLIAADGADSLARRTFWPSREWRDQGYVGWRAVVPGVPPGWEDGRVTESWGRGKRFGIAGVGSGLTYWYATATRAAAGEDDASSRREALLGHFEGWHDPVRELIAEAPSGEILRHAIADAAPSRTWTRAGRLALLGDAAHPLTPNLGQGAAMALEDAFEIARCLSERRSVPEALQLYERRRRVRLALVWALSRAVGLAVQAEGARTTALRDLSLCATPGAISSAVLGRLFEFDAR